MNMPRAYRSPARQQQARLTRSRVILAAHELFARDGLSATMRQIADRAQVSRATVESLFGSKASLLDAVVDAALAGDEDETPILQRGWVRDLAGLAAEEFVDACAAALAAGAGRVSPVLSALDDGAARHSSLVALADRLRRQRTGMATWVVAGVVDRRALAHDLTEAEAVETVLVLIDPRLQRRLLVEESWPVPRLAAWTGRAMRRLLLEPGCQA